MSTVLVAVTINGLVYSNLRSSRKHTSFSNLKPFFCWNECGDYNLRFCCCCCFDIETHINNNVIAMIDLEILRRLGHL